MILFNQAGNINNWKGYRIMKIQSINNNKNVAHKAYFDNNNVYKSLCKKTNAKNLTKEILGVCAKLPNHELRLITFNSLENTNSYTVYNTNTRKMKNFYDFEKISPSLDQLIMALRTARNSDFFKGSFKEHI